MNRRKFLQQAGIISSSAVISVGLHGWAARGITHNSNPKRLVVIFLRGAVDGLNVVVPYQETAYYDARPTIAIPRPTEPGGAIDLDGRFGLHPALAPLIPLWQQGSLGFVHACGSPSPTRSHFDAQDYMESGTPGIKNTRDGWMNRLLSVLPRHTPLQAVNLGTTTPRILSGAMNFASLPLGSNSPGVVPLDQPEVSSAFDLLYSRGDALTQVYQQGQRTRTSLMNVQSPEMQIAAQMELADNGAPLPASFPGDAEQLARIMVKDSRIELAFLALGGWDTHIKQGASTGQLAENLQFLAQGLQRLVQGLGAVYQDTAIVVMSEFGRTVRENGNGGTDHGHGNVMWLLGGGIKGGKVDGQWLGLSSSQLYEGRDLAVTTDFRHAIANILHSHLQLNQAQIQQVFPGYHNSP